MSRLAEQYQGEWARELQARGITPNGSTNDERRQSAALARARGRQLKRVTPNQALAAAAKAFAKARAAGRVRFVGE